MSSFHSTYHCSLQHCTPRNNSHIVLRKSVHFFFCCFKASIFAHPLAQCCNRVVKALSNTNVASWQHKQELHWLVLEQVAQVSLLAFSFPSAAHCWTLLNSHYHLLQKKILNTGEVNKMHISIHSYSDECIKKQLVRMSK